MSHQLIDIVEQTCLKRQRPEFHVGDTVDVLTRIREGGKERAQVFNGVVIARSGRGMNETFTVRRIVNNEGVERVFLLHSPLVVKVDVKRRGKVRRAKLYYLRQRVGKARRLRELRITKDKGGQTETAASGSPSAAGVEEDEPVGSPA